jgi:hypothetical protein
LPRPPARYYRKPTCCGIILTVDAYRTKVEKHPKRTCCCDNYPFPHRKGSLFCVHGTAGLSFYERRFYDRETRQARA